MRREMAVCIWVTRKASTPIFGRESVRVHTSMKNIHITENALIIPKPQTIIFRATVFWPISSSLS